MSNLIFDSAVEMDPHEGDWTCPICGAWASDGCEHVDAETNNLVYGIDLPAELDQLVAV